MDAKLNVVSLWAEDIRKTAHFYRDVLGLHLMPHHGDRPHFDLGGIYLVLVQGKPMIRLEGSPDHFPVLAFAVNDLDQAILRLRDSHVDLPWEVVEGHGTRWILFHDPAGNLIELVERSP
jgi:catechol 2,3-dioxygenase-like lactoylglutathione lyase family enzyme